MIFPNAIGKVLIYISAMRKENEDFIHVSLHIQLSLYEFTTKKTYLYLVKSCTAMRFFRSTNNTLLLKIGFLTFHNTQLELRENFFLLPPWGIEEKTQSTCFFHIHNVYMHN
jgi:hypothetical protein